MTRTSIAALLLLAGFLPACAQTPATGESAADQSTMTLRQEVRNVVVDVVVTSKHGEPVTDLGKASFQVLENGVPQDVAFFEHHRAAQAPKATASAAPALPPNTHTNVSTAATDGPLVVVLLDALNTPPSQQSYVHSQILDYLKKIPAGTRIAIFTLSSKLRLMQGFTSDPAVLRAALDGRSYPTSVTPFTLGPAGTGEGMRMGGVNLPFASAVASTRDSLNRFANESGSLEQELTIRYTIDALNAIGVYLAGIPGRKSLVWFSATVPWTINPDFSLVTTVTGRSDYARDLKSLADIMTVGRISIYPVSAAGLPAPGGYGANSAGSSYAQRGLQDSSVDRPDARANFGFDELHSQIDAGAEHMSMENLAKATGGRAIFNTNDLTEAVAKVEAMGEQYYTIAYSPKDKRYDGNLRRVEVRVNVPNVRMDYRRGYYADDPSKSTGRSLVVHSSPLRAAMLHGAPDATQIAFQIAVEPARRQPDAALPSARLGANAAALKGPVVRYDFHWTVDLHGIAFDKTPNGLHHLELNAALTAYDADGNVLNNTFSTLPLNLTEAQYAHAVKNGLPMKQTLDLPAGLINLRVAVVEPASGHTGATEFPIAVQAQSSPVAKTSARP